MQVSCLCSTFIILISIAVYFWFRFIASGPVLPFLSNESLKLHVNQSTNKHVQELFNDSSPIVKFVYPSQHTSADTLRPPLSSESQLLFILNVTSSSIHAKLQAVSIDPQTASNADYLSILNQLKNNIASADLKHTLFVTYEWQQCTLWKSTTTYYTNRVPTSHNYAFWTQYEPINETLPEHFLLAAKRVTILGSGVDGDRDGSGYQGNENTLGLQHYATCLNMVDKEIRSAEPFYVTGDTNYTRQRDQLGYLIYEEQKSDFSNNTLSEAIVAAMSEDPLKALITYGLSKFADVSTRKIIGNQSSCIYGAQRVVIRFYDLPNDKYYHFFARVHANSTELLPWWMLKNGSLLLRSNTPTNERTATGIMVTSLSPSQPLALKHFVEAARLIPFSLKRTAATESGSLAYYFVRALLIAIVATILKAFCSDWCRREDSEE